MAKRKKAQPWDAAFQRVRAIYHPEFNYPPKPTAADLDAAEKELIFQFPLSYRAFAEEFGLNGVIQCSLPTLLALTPPPGSDAADWSTSVVTATRFFNTHDWDEEREWDEDYPSDEFLKRIVVFAEDPGYHYWAFDRAEVLDPRLQEYRVYDLNRQHHTRPVADSFDAWLVWVAEAYTFDREDDGEEPDFALVYKPDSDHSLPIDFFRDPLRHRKTRPPAAEVALWLTFNNHTVRDLALAIRDHKQTDAFPILADALQEAGCSNDDLLNSCRTGDPDIDGAWVLQVLLGKV